MDEKEMKPFEEQLKKSLEDAYMRGLAAGCMAVNKVILKKIGAHKHDCVGAIREIQKFCSTNLNYVPEAEEGAKDEDTV